MAVSLFASGTMPAAPNGARFPNVNLTPGGNAELAMANAHYASVEQSNEAIYLRLAWRRDSELELCRIGKARVQALYENNQFEAAARACAEHGEMQRVRANELRQRLASYDCRQMNEVQVAVAKFELWMLEMHEQAVNSLGQAYNGICRTAQELAARAANASSWASGLFSSSSTPLFPTTDCAGDVDMTPPGEKSFSHNPQFQVNPSNVQQGAAATATAPSDNPFIELHQSLYGSPQAVNGAAQAANGALAASQACGGSISSGSVVLPNGTSLQPNPGFVQPQVGFVQSQVGLAQPAFGAVQPQLNSVQPQGGFAFQQYSPPLPAYQPVTNPFTVCNVAIGGGTCTSQVPPGCYQPAASAHQLAENPADKYMSKAYASKGGVPFGNSDQGACIPSSCGGYSPFSPEHSPEKYQAQHQGGNQSQRVPYDDEAAEQELIADEIACRQRAAQIAGISAQYTGNSAQYATNSAQYAGPIDQYGLPTQYDGASVARCVAMMSRYTGGVGQYLCSVGEYMGQASEYLGQALLGWTNTSPGEAPGKHYVNNNNITSGSVHMSGPANNMNGPANNMSGRANSMNCGSIDLGNTGNGQCEASRHQPNLFKADATSGAQVNPTPILLSRAEIHAIQSTGRMGSTVPASGVNPAPNQLNLPLASRFPLSRDEYFEECKERKVRGMPTDMASILTPPARSSPYGRPNSEPAKRNANQPGRWNAQNQGPYGPPRRQKRMSS